MVQRTQGDPFTGLLCKNTTREHPEGRHSFTGPGMEGGRGASMLSLGGPLARPLESPSQKLFKPHRYMEASSSWHDLLPPSPPLKMKTETESSKHLILPWPFWYPKPSNSSPNGFLIRTKDAAITQEVPRDVGALSQEPGSKANIRGKNQYS